MKRRYGVLRWTILGTLAYTTIIQAAPPLIEHFGEQRKLNDCIFYTEGDYISFTVTAENPNNDPVTLSATNLPSWSTFNETTGVFSGTAPWWATNYAGRSTQLGIYDIAFSATAGGYTATNIVSLHLLATNWPALTMNELVTNRPIFSGGDIGTPVDLTILSDTSYPSAFAGGKMVRKIVFAFTSQVAAVTGWQDDWVSLSNVVFLPVSPPAATNAGGVIEGLYSGEFGQREFAERTCAEEDLPMLVIDCDWPTGYGSTLMSKYNDRAIETGNPRWQFYAFSAAHFLRSADALATVIATVTNWPINYTNFQAVFTGHSKFGQTCVKAAAAAPERVAGFMANGCGDIDSGAARLLTLLQGAQSSKPDTSTFYLGTMMRYYMDSLSMITEQMTTNICALYTLGTDDNKGELTKYLPKYTLGAAAEQIDSIPFCMGVIPNAPHSTTTEWHSLFWRMWVAHCLLDRDVTDIEEVSLIPDGLSWRVEARVSGSPSIQKCQVWASEITDLNTNHWDDFTSYPLWPSDGIYTGRIPGSATSCFVQVTDLADGITGIVSSAPWPLNPDYPLLHQPPDDINGLQSTQDAANIYLRWTNPVSGDFVGVVITHNTNAYPLSELDDTLIYDSNGTSYTHAANTDSPHYYSAFTYDASGNYGELTPLAAGTPAPTLNIAGHAGNSLSIRIENMKIGITNRLESSTNLSADTWAETTNFISTWISTNYTLGENRGHAFYRLRSDE